MIIFECKDKTTAPMEIYWCRYFHQPSLISSISVNLTNDLFKSNFFQRSRCLKPYTPFSPLCPGICQAVTFNPWWTGAYGIYCSSKGVKKQKSGMNKDICSFSKKWPSLLKHIEWTTWHTVEKAMFQGWIWVIYGTTNVSAIWNAVFSFLEQHPEVLVSLRVE